MEERISGSKITGLYSLKSWYDNNTLRVMIGEEEYRISTDTVLQMIWYFEFGTEKKRKYKYLTEPAPTEFPYLEKKLADEAQLNAILVDALECIVEVTEEDAVRIAHETLMSIAHRR